MWLGHHRFSSLPKIQVVVILLQYVQVETRLSSRKKASYTHLPYGLRYSLYTLAFGGAKIGNFDIKPIDGATILAYLGTGEAFRRLKGV